MNAITAPVKSPDSTIVFALLASAGLVTVERLKNNQPLVPMNYVAIFAVFFVLSFLAGPAPGLARGLAILIFLGILLAKGSGVFTALKNIGHPTVKQATINAPGVDPGKTTPGGDTIVPPSGRVVSINKNRQKKQGGRVSEF
jgi:hypothetical protein